MGSPCSLRYYYAVGIISLLRSHPLRLLALCDILRCLPHEAADVAGVIVCVRIRPSGIERTTQSAMNAPITVTQRELAEFLLNVAITRPVFIWGAPGIGKSSLVQEFAERVGLPCVSLLGSQLAPEDLLGVPQIVGDASRFCPP